MEPEKAGHPFSFSRVPSKAAFFFLLFVFPYWLLSLHTFQQWVSRAIAVSLFLTLMISATFWYGLSSKTRMIMPGGRLSQPQFDDFRPQMEKRIRIFIVLFGVFACIVMGIPFARDLIQLSSTREPIRITATTVDKSVPLFGLWFLEQSVRISRPGLEYHLFYSLQPLLVGQKYEFLILPRSRVILEARTPVS
jgi:hypothetical protein